MKTIMATFIALMALSAPSPAQEQKNPRKFELEAASPKFWSIVARDAKLETVATGF